MHINFSSQYEYLRERYYGVILRSEMMDYLELSSEFKKSLTWRCLREVADKFIVI